MEVLENRNAVSVPVQQVESEQMKIVSSSMSILPPDEVAMDGFSSSFGASSMSKILSIQNYDSNPGGNMNDSNMTFATTYMRENSTNSIDLSNVASISHRIRSVDSSASIDQGKNLAPPLLLPFASTGSLRDMRSRRNSGDDIVGNNSLGSLARVSSIEAHEVSLGALSNDMLQFSRNLSDTG